MMAERSDRDGDRNRGDTSKGGGTSGYRKSSSGGAGPRRGTGGRAGRASTGDRRGPDQRGRSSRDAREKDPPLPEEATLELLDDRSRAALRGLGGVYERLGRHVVAVGLYLDADPRRALAHARTARRLGSRVGLVREVAGVAAYRAGEFGEARKELLAARRMTGEADLLPMLADCERALGKPEAAVAYLEDPLVASMEPETATEMAIVVSGALRDLERPGDARTLLEKRPELHAGAMAPYSPRLWYAYAEALLASGDPDQAQRWFEQVATVDEEHETDAAERVARWGSGPG